MLYKENLIDHYKNPRNFGKIANPSISAEQFNATCGDSIEIYANIFNNMISKISFTGNGCIVSQATASMFISSIEGKNIDYVTQLDEKIVVDMTGLNLGPNRTKCATLSLVALKNAINNFCTKG